MFATSRLARRPLLQVRSLATTAAPTHFAAQQAAPSHTTYSRSNIIPLSNVEAQWESMNLDDKILVQEQLEELQKRDWKGLSIDEKKAGLLLVRPFPPNLLTTLSAYYVAFGPHGPRAPAGKPGDGVKIFLSVLGLVGATGVLAAVASWAIGGKVFAEQ